MKQTKNGARGPSASNDDPTTPLPPSTLKIDQAPDPEDGEPALGEIRADGRPSLALVTPEDDFNLDDIRIDPAELEGSVARLITMIPTRKPDRAEFIRTRGEAAYQITARCLVLEEGREYYICARHIFDGLVGDTVAIRFVPYVNRAGVLKLWPIKAPDPADGRRSSWTESANKAAILAAHNWVRVAADMSLGGYSVTQSLASLPEPTWPDLDLTAILRIAFLDCGRYVDSFDHPAVKMLQGRL